MNSGPGLSPEGFDPPPTRSQEYEIVTETWLTRKPKGESALVAAIGTLILALGSILYEMGLFGADRWMPASRELVFNKGEYWRAWTTLFAHADAGHLFSNMFLYFILSFFLYGYFGGRLFPFGALLWGGLTNLSVLPTYVNAKTNLIGASGVVYWMGGTWLVLYFFLSRQKNFTQRWLRSLGVGILIFMPAETFQPNISYRTHFAGFLLGLVAGSWHFFAHRARFLSAEKREKIIDEVDPDDDLPPPEGF